MCTCQVSDLTRRLQFGFAHKDVLMFELNMQYEKGTIIAECFCTMTKISNEVPRNKPITKTIHYSGMRADHEFAH
jgi:hypothetical protein